jgi:hypothetical protein
MKKYFLPILILIVSLSAMGADPIAVCPSENDSSTEMAWNLAAVMRTYRDALNETEEVLHQFRQGHTQVRTEIPKKIEQVQAAIDCAAYVERNFNGSMIAPSIGERSAENQQKFLDLYKEMTAKTLGMFRELRDGLVTELAKPETEQNFTASVDLIRAIHDYENKAHRKF